MTITTQIEAFNLGRADGALTNVSPLFPSEWNSTELKWAYVAGVFEERGNISPGGTMLCCYLSGPTPFIKQICEFIGIPVKTIENRNFSTEVLWTGNNALDLLGHIYETPFAPSSTRLKIYKDWCMVIGGIEKRNSHLNQSFQWSKTDLRAVAPYKARVTDSGYDLTLIEEIKRVGNTVWFETGVTVNPPFGWYFIVASRSSITKYGYMLSNSVGIIDRGFRGSIKVVLTKTNPDMPNFELPARIVQLIPTPIVHMTPQFVESLDETHRGINEFGSSGH